MQAGEKRFTTGEVIGIAVIVAIVVGTMAFLLIANNGDDSSNESGSGSNSNDSPFDDDAEQELEACKTDTKTLKTAIVAWNVEYLSGDNPTNYATPYPPSEQALTEDGTRMLQEESDLHDLEGDGNEVPVIVKADGTCEDETINQLTG